MLAEGSGKWKRLRLRLRESGHCWSRIFFKRIDLGFCARENHWISSLEPLSRVVIRALFTRMRVKKMWFQNVEIRVDVAWWSDVRGRSRSFRFSSSPIWYTLCEVVFMTSEPLSIFTNQSGCTIEGSPSERKRSEGASDVRASSYCGWGVIKLI